MAHSFLADKLQWLLGIIGCVAVLFILAISIPVYVFRAVVVLLAKLFRTDLGDILNGQSAIFVVDYFYDTPPRSSAVLALIFEGKLSFDLVRERVEKNWILAGDSRFDKFRQHPVKWWGFSFWKDSRDTFSLDNHVFKLFGDEQVSHDQLTMELEKQVNRRIPRDRSPWEVYVIENYKNDKLPETSARRQYSVLILNFHHCLMDATGVFTCLVDGLFEGLSFSKMNRAKPKLPERSFWQSLCFMVTFPFSLFCEFSYLLSHFFRTSPLKIPDSKKDWYHVAARSDQVVPVQLIKDIKNQFGVSYASVMLSAISSAVHRILGDLKTLQANPGEGFNDNSVLCLSMLPAKGVSNRKAVSNHMTGAVFDMPIGAFDNPIDRLKAVDLMLEENRNSVVPYLSQYITTLCGSHLLLVNKLLVTNKMIPISLSNYAGVPSQISIKDDVKWILTEGLCGGFEGDTGLFIISCSHGPYLGIQVTAERAVMSQSQAQQVVTYILEEIEILRNLMMKKR